METDKGYQNLLSQKASAQQQYNATNNRIEEYSNRIERLKKTKESLSDAKKTFSSVKSSDDEVIEKKRSEWVGENFQLFQIKGIDVVTENSRYFTNSLDMALDAINNEITLLENQIYESRGVLGRLQSWLNSLANRIENYFN